jgi:hypothetical protein
MELCNVSRLPRPDLTAFMARRDAKAARLFLRKCVASAEPVQRATKKERDDV